MSTVRFPARKDALPQILAQVEDFAQNAGCDPTQKYRFLLIAEEIIVNIISYAYPDADGDILLHLQQPAPDIIRMTAEDSGVPFNPLLMPEPDTTTEVSKRRIGGFGVHFARTLSRSLQYDHTDGYNRLTFELNTSSGEPNV